MKREAKKRATRQRMIDAAVHLFSTKSFSNVSVRDIATLANVSPALIYKYFDDQEHLYMEAMRVEGRKLIEGLEPHVRLQELVSEYIHYMVKEDVLYQMMAYFMLEGSGRRPTAIPIFREVARLMGLFEQALQPLYPLEAKREAQLLFSTLNGLLITYKNYPGLTGDQTLERILSLANRYISHLRSD